MLIVAFLFMNIFPLSQQEIIILVEIGKKKNNRLFSVLHMFIVFVLKRHVGKLNSVSSITCGMRNFKILFFFFFNLLHTETELDLFLLGWEKAEIS